MTRIPDVESQLGRSLRERYRIERELGRGGMAAVYLAKDLKHGRRVAIKVLDPELGQVMGAERFLREIEIAAGLSHPRIVPLLDSGSADGLLYYVMPYVQGESLRERLERETQLPIEEAVEIARQAAGALAHAHDHGVVHRDMKPENILLSGGEAVVADFGIAHAVTAAGGTRMTRTGLVVGTPAYMSPEQASGEAEADARSDIYSLACVLYEMLAGEPPFAAPTALAVASRKLREPAPDVRAVRESVPGSVAAVLRKALARVPADRYRTTAELGEALRRAMTEGASEPAAGTRASRSTLSRGLAFGSAAALLLLATAYLLGRNYAARDAGPGFFVEFPIDGIVEIGQQMALSPDERRLAYVSGNTLWVRELQRPESRAVPGSEGARLPFWSPDGTEVGFVARGHLWRAPATGGESIAIAALGTGLAGGAGVTWTESGGLVLATGSAPLMTVSAGGGVPQVLTPLEVGEQDHHVPFALPGGRGILFVPHRTGEVFDRLEIMAEGERRELLHTEGRTIDHPVYSATGHILFAAPDGIRAVPFSLRRLEVTGEPFLVRAGAVAPSTAAGAALALLQGSPSPGLQLAFVRRDGDVDRLVEGSPDLFAPWFSLSPSGGEVALEMGNPPAIWVLDHMSGTRRRPTAGGEVGRVPRWSPDGEHLAYVGRSSAGEPTVLIRAADGSGTARETVPAWYPTFTPDGRRLVVTLGGLTPFLELVADEDLHIAYVPLDLDGEADPVLVVATSTRNCCQHVSPDGRYLAYASEVSGRREVYVTRFPSGEGTWQASTAGGFWPRWDPRGDRLYYAQGLEIMEVPVTTAPRLEVGAPRPLFSRPARVQGIRGGTPDYYDISPDGERFLVVLRAEPVEGEGASVLVVGNWREALER